MMGKFGASGFWELKLGGGPVEVIRKNVYKYTSTYQTLLGDFPVIVKRYSVIFASKVESSGC